MSAPHQDSGSDTGLANCPFCGGKAVLRTTEGWTGIGCETDKCPAYLHALMFRTPFDARARWNRRPSPAAPAAEDALLDAFGRPRVHYVRVIHDGTTCVVRPGDVADMVDSERPDDYRTQDVYLSKEEFDALPEFDGF